MDTLVTLVDISEDDETQVDGNESVSSMETDILQFDGNDTVMTEDPMTPANLHQPSSIDLSDPALLSASGSLSGSRPRDMPLHYTINQGNQARRLLENTNRPELVIWYNCPQTINGIEHPTNVSIDCNAGVYLTAVKPALEVIVKGWQTEILSTLISCDDIIDRNEMSGRKVFTKLVLFLTERVTPSVKSKVVLHFYHTSCTVQAQGSSFWWSVLSCLVCDVSPGTSY